MELVGTLLFFCPIHRACTQSFTTQKNLSKLLLLTATLTHILYSLMGAGLPTKRAFLRPHNYTIIYIYACFTMK